MAKVAKIEFLGMIDDSTTAIKISGNESGGKVSLAFDDSQLPQAMKAALFRKQLLKVTLEPVDDGD